MRAWSPRVVVTRALESCAPRMARVGILPAPAHRQRIPRVIWGAIVFHVSAALALLPVAGYPYDLSGLTGAAGSWLRWGVPLFYGWKFGFDLTVAAIAAQALGFLMHEIGMSGAAALTAAWKLPLLLSDVGIGLVLYDLGRRLEARRPELITVLWLMSPVSLWVAAGHGQIEPLTVLAFVLSLDLMLGRRFLLAGIVVGLGIGVEYVPLLMVLVVALMGYMGLATRREAVRFLLGTGGAVLACFAPPLASPIGRQSIFTGLLSSAQQTAGLGHPIVGAKGSSFWLFLGDLSPGRIWLPIAGVGCLALLAILATAARHRSCAGLRRRFAVAAAGGLLLCVVLLDPNALPQFADLSLGALCIISTAFEVPPLAVVAGPVLQLADGLLWVGGAGFQSYWYDMWAKTGDSGWPFPQSVPVADWIGAIGAGVIIAGVVTTILAAKPRKPNKVFIWSALALACAGSMFLAVWSAQPAYWQGVGRSGPSTLVDFPLYTDMQRGSISFAHGATEVSFPEILTEVVRNTAARAAIVLGVRASPLYVQDTAGNAASVKSVPGLVVPLAATGRVKSLWVNVLLGRPSWIGDPADVKRDLPMLSDGVARVRETTVQWVTPGWCIVSYALSNPATLPYNRLKLSLYGGEAGILWNGTKGHPWITVGVRTGSARVVAGGRVASARVTFPYPQPDIPGTGDGTVDGLSFQPSLNITQVRVGGQPATVTSAAVTWPLADPLDGRIGAPWLLAIGAADLGVLAMSLLALIRGAGTASEMSLDKET